MAKDQQKPEEKAKKRKEMTVKEFNKNRRIAFGRHRMSKFLGVPPTIRLPFGKINTSSMTQFLY